MEHYDLEVCGLKRELPFVKLSDGTAYASFVVISDTELIEKAGKELAAFANGAEIILTIEAKGIALAYEISKQLHMKEFVVVRKSVKSYVKSFIQDAVHSITTEGNQDIFLDETDAEKLKGKKVAIVDDVISKENPWLRQSVWCRKPEERFVAGLQFWQREKRQSGQISHFYRNYHCFRKERIL